MFNIFRMDSRRLLKSRTFYIMLAVAVAMVLFMCFMLSIMSSPEVLKAMEESGAEVDGADYQMRAYIDGMSQLTFVHECLANGCLLILAGMGMTFFAGGDFAGGYIKNICFARPGRWEYIASKVLIGGVYSGIVTVVSVLFALVLPPFFGLHPIASTIGDMAGYTFWIWLPTWAFSLMAFTMVTVTRSASLGVFMSLFCGAGFPALILGTLTETLGWPRIDKYFISSLMSVSCAPVMVQAWTILAGVAVWSVLYIAVSLLLTKKRDI